MRRLAKTLIAGTSIAILTSAVATSQTYDSVIVSDQVQTGDIFAGQTLNVVEITETTTAVTTATGAAFNGSGEDVTLDIRANQNLQANVTADTRLDAAVSSGATTALTTAATGVTSESNIYGGTLTGVYNQRTGPGLIYGHSHVEAPDAEVGDVTASTQAVGASQGFGVSYSVVGARVNQTNQADVVADGGGTYRYVEGSATFVGAATGTNVTSSGAGGSGERYIINQTNSAALTQASQFTAHGSAYLSTTSATASGDNINLYNEGGLLDVTSNQHNQAYIRAQTGASAYQFGSASSISYGVGNSFLAGNFGSETIIDAVQLNDGGGVEVIADFTGAEGYDASAHATAIGNAATGYVCSDCDGRLIATSQQVNNTDVTAATSVHVTGYARSATGVATAVGNTATYYVSRPTGH
ncbi:holdfast anchor protein HfaD [Phenylobacterium sp.]|uniref:holdfast anchor protein HfaD n=1 Tax=Phenylobacterium sp. TaxID=1871053 RepID=UPI002730AB6C|nr:holdfast anchor protein HfaD [Phenylobacterium sp.]MDP2213425.1 holdfast anchor protein HfaD [Phenylobacterium sp.]